MAPDGKSQANEPTVVTPREIFDLEFTGSEKEVAESVDFMLGGRQVAYTYAFIYCCCRCNRKPRLAGQALHQTRERPICVENEWTAPRFKFAVAMRSLLYRADPDLLIGEDVAT